MFPIKVLTVPFHYKNPVSGRVPPGTAALNRLSPDQVMAPLTVIAVHGTFVRRAKWFDVGSPLREALGTLAGDSLRALELKWGGSNSYAARQRAAHALRDLILRDVPSDRRAFVIAHSHGGNVAFLAASDREVARRVAGIVTVSTPFLNTGPRLMDSVGRLIGMSVLAAAIGLAAYLLRGAILVSATGIVRLFITLAGAAAAVFVMNGVMFALTTVGSWLQLPERMQRSAQRAALRLADERLERAKTTPTELEVTSPEVPICVVYDEYDRVPMWLKAMRFMRRTPMAMLGPGRTQLAAIVFFISTFIWGHWGPGAWPHETPLVVTDEDIRIAVNTPNPAGAGNALTVMEIAKHFPAVPRAYAATLTFVDHSALALSVASLEMTALVASLELVHFLTGLLFGAAPWAYGTLGQLGVFGPWLTDFDISQLPLDRKDKVHEVPVVAPDVFRHSPLFDPATCMSIRRWIEQIQSEVIEPGVRLPGSDAVVE